MKPKKAMIGNKITEILKEYFLRLNSGAVIFDDIM